MGVAACQTAPTKTGTTSAAASVPVNEQMNQLASLVAASKYLRVQCERSDLPDDGVFLKTAMKVAGQKGWDTRRYTSLPQLSESLYQGLVKDGTPKTTQCSAFNRSIAPFIDAMRTTR
ncbi:type II secretion system pilot lipoprotein GspS [Dickeya lacustris]|uniref:Type II secretion system pilot lipoprotein GspS n=1 Tax=Dickeya lacustris TaxID=2259638 RepID=A0ABY8G9N7_9GAMM|nr:type II secretion system pilot lipoprotein GspS [Dickeya lacustris]WFN56676.1 type II secretion system pilot lipoprotein GspS [Dickeya lacustris]